MSILSFIPGSPAIWLKMGLAVAIFSAGAWSGRAWEKDTSADLRLERAQYDRDVARADLEQSKKDAKADIDSLQLRINGMLNAQRAKVTPDEVREHAKESAGPVIDDALGLRLDEAAGVPADVTNAARAAAGSALDMELSLRRVVNALAGRSTELAECRAAYDAVRLRGR